ncbi:MAG: acyl carrier protein [Clostridia bacterium]
MFEEIKKILLEELNVEEYEISLSSKIREDLGADSLDLVQIIMAIEEHFNIEIDEDEITNDASVQQIIEYIKTKK